MKIRTFGALGVSLLLVASLASGPVLAKTKSKPTASSFPAALSQKQAVQVVLQYYKENNQANSTLSVALQDKDEEGISAKMDDANYHLLGLEGTTSIPAFTALRQNISVYLTNATKAPAEFLALVKFPAVTGANPVAAYADYLVFRKDTGKAPWRVLYDIGVTSTTSVPATTSVKGRTSNYAFAAIVNYWKNGRGKVAPGPYTSGLYTSTQQGIATDASHGITDTLAFTVDSSPVTSAAVRGGTLEFGGIDSVTTETATTGSCVSSSPTDFAEYLAIFPSGVKYGQTVDHRLVQVVIFVPSNRDQDIHLLGYYSQLLGGSGTACP
ncbi:MAG TPA: hypothetical protein VNF24_06380 [Candidatus Acidoferrales bacterium]|nr:hypothetical protein [Candidatus Acidoferrales bacterium]